MAYFHIKMIARQELQPSSIKDQICQKKKKNNNNYASEIREQLEINLIIKAPLSYK